MQFCELMLSNQQRTVDISVAAYFERRYKEYQTVVEMKNPLSNKSTKGFSKKMLKSNSATKGIETFEAHQSIIA